jgi:hypothetical protein
MDICAIISILVSSLNLQNNSHEPHLMKEVSQTPVNN